MRAAAAQHGARRRIDRRAVMVRQVRRAGLMANALSGRPAAKALVARRVVPKAIVMRVPRGASRVNGLNGRPAVKDLLARPAVPKVSVRRAALKANAGSAGNATAVSGRHALLAMKARAARPLAVLVARAVQTTRAVPAPHAPAVPQTLVPAASVLRGENMMNRVGAAHPSVPALAPIAQAPRRAARSTAHRVTKARAEVRQAGATAGVTSARLRTNAASARSPHRSSEPMGIGRSAHRARTAAREHPHGNSASVRHARSVRSVPIAAYPAIARQAHARLAAATTSLPATASASASVRHALTRHRAAQPRWHDPRVRKHPRRARPHIVATTTTPRAPCAFPS